MKNNSAMRPVSWMLSCLIAFTSVAMVLVGSTVARAQEAAHVPLLAVLDFDNSSGYGGPEVGRVAADALVVELSKSNKYEVISRSELAAHLASLGLQAPLDSIDIQRLGRDENADGVVSGEVLSISRDTHTSQVQAVVAVRITDTSTGELINGSLAEGVSTVHVGEVIDDDSLVDDAISKAIYAAAKQIVNYNLPTATILNNESDTTVLLDKGSRDGLVQGMSMIVLREGTIVGRVRVATVYPDSSEAVVTDEGVGVRPGDVGRVIYSLPSYSKQGDTVVTNSNIATGSALVPRASNAFGSVGGIILAIAAAALFVGIVNRGHADDSLGGAALGSSSAQAGYGAELGLDDTLYYVLIPNEAESTTNPFFEAPGVGNYITWTTGNLNPNSIIGFNIYRDDFEPYSTFVGSSTASTTTTTTTTVGFVFNEGPIGTAPGTSRFFIDSPAYRDITFPFVTFVSATGTTTTSTSTTSSTTSTGINVGGLGSATILIVPGLTVSKPEQYEVTAVYQVDITGTTSTTGGTTTGGTNSTATTGNQTIGYEETPIDTSQTGYATAVPPIDATSEVYVNDTGAFQNTNVNFASATISFNSVNGADTYVLDLSSNSHFTDKQTLTAPFTISSGGQLVSFPNKDLNTLFPGASEIFYRVGLRDSIDSPGPVNNPTLNINPDVLSNGSSYIYSGIGYFTEATGSAKKATGKLTATSTTSTTTKATSKPATPAAPPRFVLPVSPGIRGIGKGK